VTDPTPNPGDGFASFERALQQREQELLRDYLEVARTDEYADDLRRAFAIYDDVETFAPGDLVQWKPLMRDQRLPTYGAPAVVIEYLADPQTHDSDGDLMTEPLDIVLGVIDGNQTFHVYSFASRRFTAWSND
jgi:hypothetical protein